jgi:hypothetical protein
MSTATLSPVSDPGDEFDRITARYDNDQPVKREPSRWVSEREAIAEGLGFRRHRTRERGQ